MAEVTLNDRQYRLLKLDALTQLAIAVKLLPVVPSLKPLMAAAAEMDQRIAEADRAVEEGREPDAAPPEPEIPDELIVNLGTALQKLGDDGRNYIIGACLRGVLMETEGGGFLPAWSTRTDTPDPAIDVVTMIRLVYAVVMDNIAPFSTALASK